MDSGEFHAHVVKIAKRCKFPNPEAEERDVRDTIFLGMNSTQAREKAINLMNEEGKELPVEFLIQQLEIEDCNAQHKSPSQLDSTTSVNFAAYDHRQNRGKSNKSKQASGKNQVQNNSGILKLLLIQNQKTRRKSWNHYVQMDLHWRYLSNRKEVLTLNKKELWEASQLIQ